MPTSRSLTPAVIASAALRVGDRDGPKAMTMRRIAADLGCDPMALYRYFANREALLDAVADSVLAEVDDPDPDASWDDRVRAIATDLRAAALRHRGIAAHLASRPPLGANGSRLSTGLFAALTQAGLPPASAVRAAQALIVYLASALAMAVRAGARDARWVQVSQTISRLPDAPPGEALMIAGSDEQFDYGLHLLIAGIRVEASGPRHP